MKRALSAKASRLSGARKMTGTHKTLELAHFMLLGHDVPYGHYPAPVIPIGRIGSELVAIYPGGERPTADIVSDERDFVRYSPKTLRRLSRFDPITDRLFAYSDSDIAPYAASDELQFFHKLLKSDKLRNCKEPTRRLLAERIEQLRSEGPRPIRQRRTSLA